MSDENQSNTEQKTPRSRRRKFFLFGLLGALATLVVVPFAWAHNGWRGKKPSEHQIREHAGGVADRIMSKLDGTDEQRDALDDLIDEVFPDAMALRKEGRGLAERFHRALTAQSLNRAELENLRQEGLALADKASRRGLDALLKFNDILTPEQRAQVRDHLKARGARGCGGGHWHDE